ncbi:hypothetical protein ACJX0J_012852, partial [Zea mays]
MGDNFGYIFRVYTRRMYEIVESTIATLAHAKMAKYETEESTEQAQHYAKELNILLYLLVFFFKEKETDNMLYLFNISPEGLVVGLVYKCHRDNTFKNRKQLEQFEKKYIKPSISFCNPHVNVNELLKGTVCHIWYRNRLILMMEDAKILYYSKISKKRILAPAI